MDGKTAEHLLDQCPDHHIMMFSKLKKNISICNNEAYRVYVNCIVITVITITDHVTFTMVVMYLWSKSVSIICYLNISNIEILSLNYNTKLLYSMFDVLWIHSAYFFNIISVIKCR